MPFGLGAAVLICGIGGVGAGIYREYLVKSQIQRHGQRQEATVLHVYQRRFHTRRYDDCDVIADFQINPQGWAGPLTRPIRLADCNENSSAVSYVMQHHTLPIAYDVTNPSVVHINFDDEVFREDTARTMKLHLLILSIFAALGVFAVTALSLVRRP